MLVNQSGVVHVSLMKKGVQSKRSVTLLVAEHFLEPPKHDSFVTPINLDGDRYNNVVDNLVWRPRWFAVKYFQQFKTDVVGFPKPIEEMKTHEQFESSWEAATTYGLLDREILLSMMQNNFVWPTFQRFRALYD